MSEHDITPDPIDQAYVQAEALLDDEAARAARRARVLAAVARQPAASEPRRAARGLFWGHGRWLAAASVAGIGLLVGLRFYQPAEPPPPPRAASPSVAASQAPAAQAATDSASAVASAGAPTSINAAPPMPVTKPTPPQPAPPPAVSESIAARDQAVPAQAPAAAAPPPGPAPSPPVAVGQFAARPAPPPPPPPPPAAPKDTLAEADSGTSVEQVVVTSERRAAPEAGPATRSASKSMLGSTPAIPAKPVDKAASLRAAAAAGRTSEIAALLDQGAGVDVADEDGDTALIKAVRGGRAAAAGLLRRRGADLDLKNNAGQSARDIAQARGDRALNRALGLSR